jgi:hypothetical protein
MVGMSSAIEVRDWHLTQLPSLGTKAGRTRRTLARITPRLEGTAERLAALPWSGARAWERPVRRVLSGVRRRTGFELPPGALARPVKGGAASPDVLIVLETHLERSVRCEPVDSATVAAKLAAMVLVESVPALQTELAFQYAFPEGGRPGAEGIPQLVTSMLHDAVAGKPAYLVSHPYPCSLESLRRTIGEILSRHRSGPPVPRPVARAPFPAPVSRAPWRSVSSANREAP